MVSHIFENEDKAAVLMFKLALQSWSRFQATKLGQKFIFEMLYKVEIFKLLLLGNFIPPRSSLT